MTRFLDIVAVFLIGEDHGASKGNWVYVRAPVKWYQLFQEWLATLPPADRSRYQHRFRMFFSDWMEISMGEGPEDRSAGTSLRRS